MPTLLEDLEALVNDHTRNDCDREAITAAEYSRCIRVERLRAAAVRIRDFFMDSRNQHLFASPEAMRAAWDKVNGVQKDVCKCRRPWAHDRGDCVGCGKPLS